MDQVRNAWIGWRGGNVHLAASDENVYTAYGYAMYQASEYEHGLQNLLTAWQGSSDIADLFWEADENYSLMLRNLTDKLIGMGLPLDPLLHERLYDVVGDRNFLAHSYFWHRHRQIESAENDKLAAELHATGVQFRRLQEFAVASAGVDRVDAEALAKGLRQILVPGVKPLDSWVVSGLYIWDGPRGPVNLLRLEDGRNFLFYPQCLLPAATHIPEEELHHQAKYAHLFPARVLRRYKTFPGAKAPIPPGRRGGGRRPKVDGEWTTTLELLTGAKVIAFGESVDGRVATCRLRVDMPKARNP